MKPLIEIVAEKRERRIAVLYFCVFVLVFVLCNMAFFTPENALFPQEPYLKMVFMDKIKAKNPEIIMVGNSMLESRVDDDYFSELTNLNSVKVSSGGAASAFWYLALKNIIIPSVTRQTTVAVFFRDHYLTDPDFRVNGNYYRTQINAIAEEEEPLLYALAYDGKKDFLSRLLYRYLPLYKNRERCSLMLEDLVKKGSVYRGCRTKGR